MKLKEISSKYGVNMDDFETFVRDNGLPYKIKFATLTIADSDVEGIVDRYKKERELEERDAAIKRAALAEILITSGFSFDGYTITKYSGYISGDDVVQISRQSYVNAYSKSLTNVGDSLMDSLKTIRRNALTELKEAAYALGCNAVIGVDFDYLTLAPETGESTGGWHTVYLPYVFGVTANGNAVCIEKKKI